MSKSPHQQEAAASTHDLDEAMMRRAIALARKGQGRVEPNPMVGCVIVRGGRVVGEGFHRRFGGDHAEIEALRAAGAKAKGATAYVSLEPCCHHGKTPPCTDALVRAGVSRVLVPLRDPDPRVRGQGLRRLRAAGIEVMCGLLRNDAREVLAPFLTRARLRRPYVMAKWAQSLDGKLSTRTGDSKWISCDAARRMVHRLRARVDAIVIGSGTAIADDPLLTARDVPLRRRACRVVLDARLRLPPSSKLVKTAGDVPTMVLTSHERADSPQARRLKRSGVHVGGASTRRDGVNLASCLRFLAKQDITNVLVEGGPTLLSALFRARLVDEALVFTAPIMIGGDGGLDVLGDRPAERVSDALRPLDCITRRVGDDVLHHLRFTRPPVN